MISMEHIYTEEQRNRILAIAKAYETHGGTMLSDDDDSLLLKADIFLILAQEAGDETA